MSSAARGKAYAELVTVTYLRRFPGAWPGLSEYVEARVEEFPGGDWYARCHLSLPNEAREQWNAGRRYATRDEAAAHAAAFVLEAERILAALAAGEEPAMPHRIMRAECAAAVAADPAIAALRGKYHERSQAISDFELAWYRARDFRSYVGRTP